MSTMTLETMMPGLNSYDFLNAIIIFLHKCKSSRNKIIFTFSLQSVGGLQIVDCLSSRTYELDNLSQVFVYSSEVSPFLHQY